jgi:hypothetical protein
MSSCTAVGAALNDLAVGVAGVTRYGSSSSWAWHVIIASESSTRSPCDPQLPV